jgi:hypothetical protein
MGRYTEFACFLGSILTFCAIMLMTSDSYAQPTIYNHYVNSTWGFELEYPMDWEVDTADSSEIGDRYTQLVTFYTPLENDDDPWRDYILIGHDKLPSRTDLDSYLNEAIDLYGSGEGFQLISSSTEGTLSGSPAYAVTFEERASEPPPPVDLKSTEIATIVDGEAYYIRYTAERNSYSDYLPIFNEVISSFKLSGADFGNTEEAEDTEETTTEPELPDSENTSENTVAGTEGGSGAKQFQGVSSPAGTGLLSYENQFFGIRKLVYPDGWSISENETQIQISSPSKTKDVSTPSLYVTIYLANNRTLEAVATDNFRYYSSNPDVFTIIEAKPIELKGGQPAQLEVLAFAGMPPGTFYKALTVLVVKNDLLYMIEYIAEDEQYQKCLPTAVNMIKSLVLSSTSEAQANENISEPPAVLSPL